MLEMQHKVRRPLHTRKNNPHIHNPDRSNFLDNLDGLEGEKQKSPSSEKRSKA